MFGGHFWWASAAPVWTDHNPQRGRSKASNCSALLYSSSHNRRGTERPWMTQPWMWLYARRTGQSRRLFRWGTGFGHRSCCAWWCNCALPDAVRWVSNAPIPLCMHRSSTGTWPPSHFLDPHPEPCFSGPPAVAGTAVQDHHEQQRGQRGSARWVLEGERLHHACITCLHCGRSLAAARACGAVPCCVRVATMHHALQVLRYKPASPPPPAYQAPASITTSGSGEQARLARLP